MKQNRTNRTINMNALHLAWGLPWPPHPPAHWYQRCPALSQNTAQTAHWQSAIKLIINKNKYKIIIIMHKVLGPVCRVSLRIQSNDGCSRCCQSCLNTNKNKQRNQNKTITNNNEQWTDRKAYRRSWSWCHLVCRPPACTEAAHNNKAWLSRGTNTTKQTSTRPQPSNGPLPFVRFWPRRICVCSVWACPCRGWAASGLQHHKHEQKKTPRVKDEHNTDQERRAASWLARRPWNDRAWTRPSRSAACQCNTCTTHHATHTISTHGKHSFNKTPDYHGQMVSLTMSTLTTRFPELDALVAPLSAAASDTPATTEPELRSRPQSCELISSDLLRLECTHQSRHTWPYWIFVGDRGVCEN